MVPSRLSGISEDINKAAKRQTPVTIKTVMIPQKRLMLAVVFALLNVFSQTLIKFPISTTG